MAKNVIQWSRNVFNGQIFKTCSMADILSNDSVVAPRFIVENKRCLLSSSSMRFVFYYANRWSLVYSLNLTVCHAVSWLLKASAVSRLPKESAENESP